MDWLQSSGNKMSGMRSSNEFGEASSSLSRSTSSSLYNFFPGESSSSVSSFLDSVHDGLLFHAMRIHQHGADHFDNNGIDDSRFCENFNQMNIKGKAKVDDQLDFLGNFGSFGFGVANSSHDLRFSSFAGTANFDFSPQYLNHGRESHFSKSPPMTQPRVHHSLSNISEVRGFIYAMAKNLRGCLYLEWIIDKGNSEDIAIIFSEIGPYVTELMIHPHGNHLIQKILDRCIEDQRTVIIRMATAKLGELITISRNIYGTRVIQRLIRSIKTEVQISLVRSALRFGVFDLITDSNGNHVIQHCLRFFSAEDNKFIFDVATTFCSEIAINEYGCFIIQKCIESSSGQQQQNLMVEVSRNSLYLAQDPFGNYVVQCVIKRKNYAAVSTMRYRLRGHYVHLSMQKFSSHVVEKFLINSPKSRLQIIIELISYPNFDQVLQHPFANFVIQTAFDVTKDLLYDNLHKILIEAIRPHEILRFDPWCRNIFSRYF